MTDAVRELQAEVRELRTAVVELRSEAGQYRAETEQLRTGAAVGPRRRIPEAAAAPRAERTAAGRHWKTAFLPWKNHPSC